MFWRKLVDSVFGKRNKTPLRTLVCSSCIILDFFFLLLVFKNINIREYFGDANKVDEGADAHD